MATLGSIFRRSGLGFSGADWDVWSHAYNMIGLLQYYRYTGNEAALAAVRRMCDLLIATFPPIRAFLPRDPRGHGGDERA